MWPRVYTSIGGVWHCPAPRMQGGTTASPESKAVAERPLSQRQLSRGSSLQATFWKTELCRYYSPEHGHCDKGESCPFAHGPEELRTRPDLTKTALCQLWRRGKCDKGRACPFAHGFRDLRAREQGASEGGAQAGVPEMRGRGAARRRGVAEVAGRPGPTPPPCPRHCAACWLPGQSVDSRFCAWCGGALAEGPLPTAAPDEQKASSPEANPGALRGVRQQPLQPNAVQALADSPQPQEGLQGSRQGRTPRQGAQASWQGYSAMRTTWNSALQTAGGMCAWPMGQVGMPLACGLQWPQEGLPVVVPILVSYGHPQPAATPKAYEG